MPATWQAGDTQPPIRFRIMEEVDGVLQPLNLTNVTVWLRFGAPGQEAAWERECQRDDPLTDGKCHYEWEDDDLAVSGEYEAQVVLEIDGTEMRLTPIFPIIVERSIPAPT